MMLVGEDGFEGFHEMWEEERGFLYEGWWTYRALPSHQGPSEGNEQESNPALRSYMCMPS